MRGKLRMMVLEVRELERGASGMLWHLGHKLQELYDTQLWKRVSPSWRTFTKVHLGFTYKWAFTLMRVAKEFTEMEVQRFGVSKLYRLVLAPEKERAQLRKMLEEGASRLDIERAREIGGREVCFTTSAPIERAKKAYLRLDMLERERFAIWVQAQQRGRVVKPLRKVA